MKKMIKHRTDLNKLMPKRKLVGAEIGVASGLNSNDMLTYWNIKKLYLVDIWESIPTQFGDASSSQDWHDFNYQSTKRVMERHGRKAVFLKGMSVEMSKNVENESLDFIYIDGDHSYEGVMADLIAWVPKVKPGGIVAGHDYLNPDYGVHAAVNDFAKGVDIITIPEHKEEDASFYFFKEC